jgi:hypothetical protein
LRRSRFIQPSRLCFGGREDVRFPLTDPSNVRLWQISLQKSPMIGASCAFASSWNLSCYSLRWKRWL